MCILCSVLFSSPELTLLELDLWEPERFFLYHVSGTRGIDYSVPVEKNTTTRWFYPQYIYASVRLVFVSSSLLLAIHCSAASFLFACVSFLVDRVKKKTIGVHSQDHASCFSCHGDSSCRRDSLCGLQYMQHVFFSRASFFIRKLSFYSCWSVSVATRYGRGT